MNLIESDKELIWHPFTQEKTADPVMFIKKAKGCYLYDENDKAYLDLVSSWWVNIHGHANELIARAIYEQSLTLEHVIFAGFTHKPAVEICRRLKTVLPADLTKFFFSDNGSTAVEVAIKMCYQHYRNRDGFKNKTTFLCFDGAYHGDTVGAMSVGIGSGYHDQFRKLLFPVLTVPYPETWYGDENVEEKEKRSIDVLTERLINDSDQIVAFIIEPLIQGASGMRMCRPGFLKRAIDLTRQFKVRIIFDEIFVGFGRTGTNFALEQVERVPDVICLSKGLTGGFLPLALTITTDEIYESFLSDHGDQDKTFYHGHSYTANPLGCSAAIASLNLLTDDDTTRSIKDINECHKTHLFKLQTDYRRVIEHARITGTVAAFNLKDENKVKSFKRKCLHNGLVLRPLGTTFYLLPPYCITKNELIQAYVTIRDILESL